MTPDWYDTLVGDWHRPLHAVVKVVLLFLTAVVAFRLTQRRTLAQLAPFDWVAAVAVGAIIGRTATATDASFLTGAAALVALLVAHGVVTRLRFLPGVSRFTDPPGLVLVRDGAVVTANLRRSGITDADLEVLLRERGAPPVTTIELAVLEPRGAVTLVLAPVPEP